MEVVIQRNGINPQRLNGVVKVLVRHGESWANTTLHIIGGYTPLSPLTERGKKQAAVFGGALIGGLRKILGEDFTIVRLSASPAVRTQQTAQIARAAMGPDYAILPIFTDQRLRELSKGNRWLGGHEGRLRSKIETEAYWRRREKQGWDFRHGT